MNEELCDALGDYSKNIVGQACIPQLVDRIKKISDIEKFVAGLRPEQLDGRMAVLGAYQPPIIEGCNGCAIDLYWNPESKRLSVDWGDTEFQAWRAESGYLLFENRLVPQIA